MRKEILIAIVVGVGVGIAVAFGIWRANSALKTNLPELPSLLQKQSPTEVPSEFKITLSQPEQNDVISESPVTVAGITKPASTIVILGETEDYVLETDNQGSFSQEVELTSGVNQILIAAYDAASENTQSKLTIVYSSEFAKDIVTPSVVSPTSKEDNAIREKVQEKLQAARNNPKAYIGSVTDKTLDSLQIKDESDEIQLVSVDPENVAFAKVLTKSTSKISFNDIAIGDFIVAMGLKNGNNVLTAVRILVTEPLETLNRRIVLGEIINIAKKEVTLQEKNGSEIILQFPKSWKGPDLDELEEENILFAFGEFEGNALNIRTIKVAEKEVSPTPAEE
ncbi:hypothetical protein A2715_01875 [Candidatus Woesebacteria bacterium RIFCSPHIGHO2_01_FULL_39_32]|uniref:Bacterial Ig domain-containing protein n=2 Tax=Candidatus Woeseibacteriota TaxID=1752722 RepID=A0A0G0S7V9_9BACT|nr:MAG: hypothetical protein UT61_C0001G0014 [Candidatus Woesebacteria bacterium GW2011_GWA1_39_8]OGM23906.1 MAG: hypothetical protein A2715_01875 [Candidatus Woesebacteria bacterium RIFCSPHIGHO2_01_FULL_39_32]OGM37413.1 MAG: hypothetical protein A3F01_03110 [Candidatus Woesebacteria bacterium RIFCSPHIGHO2_12_FULL_38_11]OGM64095.1 MAG: hypothetical protein A2893_03115 [Candidatus Woesebacteria bacterium RIFCSPLOWO2_01_FULL_39_25]